MTIEVPEQIRAVLEEAGLLDDQLGRAAKSIAEDEPVAATLVVVDAIRKLSLTVEALVLATLQPYAPAGGDLEEVEAGWYVVELMGHRRRHGYVRTVRLAGRQVVEITSLGPVRDADGYPIPGETKELVERYAAAAIFSLTESTEDDAREESERPF